MGFSRTSLFSFALLPVAITARAEIYLSSAEAARLIFPGVKLEEKTILLSEDERKAIEKSSGESPPKQTELKVLLTPKKDAFFVDQVLGKHELITFAVGIRADGTVAGIEILEYRETYGQQVRDPAWRAQFIGKDIHSPLKAKDDIRIISGATLSSAHVTAGVKRWVHAYPILRKTF